MTEAIVGSNSLDHFSLLDWDFREESAKSHYPHNICWYPSRFVPQIPAQFITALGKKGDLIYDPFCSCGTTLVESMRLGRRALATDVNPVATFLTSVKARILAGEHVDIGALKHMQNALAAGSGTLLEGLPPVTRPEAYFDGFLGENLPEIANWYHRETLEELLRVRAHIDDFRGLTADVAKAVFLAILMPASGLPTGRPYTYYADNVKPKISLIEKDAGVLFRARLSRVITGQQTLTSEKSSLSWDCRQGNLLALTENELPEVDLIVTSPPYLGVTDYITGFRLAQLWYDFDCDLSEIKKDEIGARWKRKRPNGLGDYLDNMRAALNIMCNRLRLGGHICLVIGESKRYSDAVLDNLVEYARETLGLELVTLLRRNISQNFFLHPNGGVGAEDIVILRKL